MLLLLRFYGHCSCSFFQSLDGRFGLFVVSGAGKGDGSGLGRGYGSVKGPRGSRDSDSTRSHPFKPAGVLFLLCLHTLRNLFGKDDSIPELFFLSQSVPKTCFEAGGWKMESVSNRTRSTFGKVILSDTRRDDRGLKTKPDAN